MLLREYFLTYGAQRYESGKMKSQYTPSMGYGAVMMMEPHFGDYVLMNLDGCH